jgi:cytochrome b561
MLHWFMGGGFVLLLLAGQQFNLNLTEPYRIKGLMLHSTLGTLVFFACLFLATKRFIRRDPRPDNGLSGFKHHLAFMAQGALYLLALLVPLTGMAAALYSELPTRLFGVWDISQFTSNVTLFQRLRLLHEWVTFSAIAVASSHIAAAFYHHFIKRDQVLASMLIRLRK